MWTEIFTALALVLVIEGLLPFAAPGTYRRVVAEVTRLGDNSMRTAGLILIIAGLFLLFFVRGF